MKHTPGPWRIPLDEPYDAARPTHYLEDGPGHQLALVARLPEVGPEQHLANLRLIAAAPDLLRSLDRLLGDECECDAPGAIRPCAYCEGWDAYRKATEPPR